MLNESNMIWNVFLFSQKVCIVCVLYVLSIPFKREHVTNYFAADIKSTYEVSALNLGQFRAAFKH